jgi:GNAT superfamily N-acetyltransferase
MKESDKEAILRLSERFSDFELMGWRNPDAMKKAQLRIARASFESYDPNADLFIAEDHRGEVLGYLHVTRNVDFFTGEEQGFILAIVVSKDAEGKGVAKKLMLKAEEWTKVKGYKQLVLNVFANNERAVNFYSHLNYETENLKMVKEL